MSLFNKFVMLILYRQDPLIGEHRLCPEQFGYTSNVIMMIISVNVIYEICLITKINYHNIIFIISILKLRCVME